MLPRIAAQRERPPEPKGPGGRFLPRAQYCEAKVVVHICGPMPLWMA